MTFLRESVALPVARSLTHHHALRRVASRVFAFRLGPAGIVSSGGTGISELGTRDRYVSIAVLSFGEALSRLPLFQRGRTRPAYLLRERALCSRDCQSRQLPTVRASFQRDGLQLR